MWLLTQVKVKAADMNVKREPFKVQLTLLGDLKPPAHGEVASLSIKESLSIW